MASLVAYPFVGSFKAAKKEISTQDLGIDAGDVIFIKKISLDFTSSSATVVSVSVVDLFTTGTDYFGPRSPPRAVAADGRTQLTFVNPNPAFATKVVNSEDNVAEIQNYNADATLTFTGVIWIQHLGSNLHVVS